MTTPSSDETERWRLLSEAQEIYDAENPGRSFAGPLFQEAARDKLAVLHEQFEAGDRLALLEALHVCAGHELTIPEWAATGYMAAYREVIHHRAKNWDEVFGRPYPGKHLASLRRRRKLSPVVWTRIRELRQGANPPVIDEALFERVGAEFEIGKTVCSELYYEHDAVWGLPRK